MIKFGFVLSFSIAATFSLEAAETTSKNLSETNDREIAARAISQIPGTFTQAQFLSCVPRESIPYPKALPEDWMKKVFDHRDLSDLRKCNTTDCAFNFSKDEREKFASLKTDDERKKEFFKVYGDRVHNRVPIHTEFFIHGKDQSFEDCRGDELSKVLDQRPAKGLPYRLGFAKYSDRMRPTVRLLQSNSWKASDTQFCFAEALLYSDHYDNERAEVWSLKNEKDHAVITLQVRHRIDLLNSWVRRLNKPKFKEEVARVSKEQTEEAVRCLSKLTK